MESISIMATLIQYQTKASLYDGPFDSVAGWSAAGMGYLIKTDGGKLIAIDGGYPNDAESFLELIESNSNGKAVVDLWIITHPHGDHYYALFEIAKREELKKRLCVNTILYHFPEEFTLNKPMGEDVLRRKENMEFICASLGAKAYTPAVDEKIVIDNTELHFLYTPTDCLILNNPNQLSLIFTVQGPEKKLMITGDAFKRNLQIVVWRYDKALKCDILQMPHHGLCDTGLSDFYKRVNAKTVLIPISIAGDRCMNSDMYKDAPLVNRQAENNADTVYKSFEGTVEIEI